MIDELLDRPKKMSSTGVEEITPTTGGNLTAKTSSVSGSPPLGEKDEISTVKEVGTLSSDDDKDEKKEEGEEAIDLTSEEYAGIPELVRNIVTFEDDPTLPVITFRSILLSVVFCVLGSFVSQLS